MSFNALLHKHIGAGHLCLIKGRSCSKESWLNWLTWIIVLGLFIAGMWMRLHLLGIPVAHNFDDEGVYLQSLRAMTRGASLYQQIFYAQPPFFLLSIYPFYALFGQTIWSARLGIAIISLFGLLGALLLGKALAGRLGMIMALLLLVTSPFYLTESQSLLADGPSTALALLAVALAYLWWKRPNGIGGYWLAMLTGITLALSLLTKLLVLSILAPISLLVLVRLWLARKQAPAVFFTFVRPVLIGCLAFILTIVIVLLPFSHALPQLWKTVATYHLNARNGYYADQMDTNSSYIGNALKSLLGIIALFGTIVAFLRRDWRIIPLLVWFSTTLDFLLEQSPLLDHHLIVLIPPLIALAIMGIAPSTPVAKHSRLLINIETVLTVILVLIQVVSNIQSIQAYYGNLVAENQSSAMKQEIVVLHDLQRLTGPDQLVITDAQFIAALADRNTPDSLADTSNVRILSGYLTTQQLIAEASQPQVHAVLFYTYRLDDGVDLSFYNWVKQHFQLADHYGDEQELWVKKELLMRI